MDNNNFNGQMGGQSNMPSNPQPQPNMQPGVQPNMQMNNQMGPMSQPMPMQPNMGQGPYPQQMMKPPKKPMDPAKKKKMIIIIVVLSILLVAGIALAIILPIVLKVDYTSAFQTVEELDSEFYKIYYCSDIVDYVDDGYIDSSSYSCDIEGCKEFYDSDVNDLVAKLENTDGVKRDNDIKEQFEKFKSRYATFSSKDMNDLSSKLDLWQAEHDFVYTVYNSGFKWGTASASDLKKAANYLIKSGNDSLKTYGEDWLKRALEFLEISNTCNGVYLDLLDDDDQSCIEYYDKSDEFNEWEEDNKPDINAIAPLDFGDISKMRSEFDSLRDLIIKTYQEKQGYNLDDNLSHDDCVKLLGEDLCD